MKATASLAATGAGLLFGAGLLISGLADPARVLGFLTLAPGWDPTLAFVMGGALAVALPGYALLHRLRKPLLAAAFAAPASRKVDARLLGGAALFGVGWGLAGYCPGPAIAGATLGQPAALLFVLAMVAGAALADHAA